jgi:peptidoglycan biosynthesis protein MviN/MurJ (putative lipid II flippase)
MQDSWAPLKVLAIASSVNLIGDILLCTVLGYGIAGAAWATMASQVRLIYLIRRNANTTGLSKITCGLNIALSDHHWKGLIWSHSPQFLDAHSCMVCGNLLSNFDS